MTLRHFVPIALPLLLATTLAACNDDDDSSAASSVTLSASAALGLVQHATVNFYQVDGVTLLGSGDSGASGTFRLDLGGYTGPVLVEVLGDDDAVYFDEAAGTLIPFPPGASLHALVPTPGGEVAVTPLTEIAYRAAVARSLLGALDAEQAAALNEAVRAALAPGLTDVLSLPTVFDAATTANSLGDDEAGRYALYLAALAQLGAGEGAPALAVLTTLLADLEDDVIDGLDGDGMAVSAPYASFRDALLQALNDMAAAYGTAALQANAAGQAPARLTVDYGAGAGSSSGEPVCPAQPATLNAALVGSYTLSYFEGSAGGPFLSGETVAAEVRADGSLVIAGRTLSGPSYCLFGGTANTAEIIWVDAEAQVEYALTNNDSGTFNEINVGDQTSPQDLGGTPYAGFLGQLTPVSDGGGDGGGDGDPLAGAAGVSGTVGGHLDTVTDLVLVQEGSGLVGISARSNDNAHTWNLQFPLAVGSHDCVPNGGAGTFIQYFRDFGTDNQLIAEALGNGGGSCTISVTLVDSDKVEGTFTAILIDEDDLTYSIGDGVFSANRQ